MAYEPTERQAYFESLLVTPGERANVDYKSAVAFVGRQDDFTVKLCKHIIGMANAGGGELVIGYSDDLQADSVLDDIILNSYDTTRISDLVNHFVQGEGRVSLSVTFVENPRDNKRYPVISIDGFRYSPFFCASDYAASNGQWVLRRGLVYVRRSGAETIAITEPADWNALIDRCVELRRDEFLRGLEATLRSAGIRLQEAGAPSSGLEDIAQQYRARIIGQ